MTSSALFITALLAIPSGYLVAAPEENLAPQKAASIEQASGEIEYAFDTASNRTTVVFAASLEPRSAWRRFLFGTPAVHTIRAAYAFEGRARSRAPDTIRISLLSDEYIVAPEDRLPFEEPEPVLSIMLSDTTVTRYAVGAATRREISSARLLNSSSSVSIQQPRIIVQLPPTIQEIDISRTATASLPLCDFLGLIDQDQVRGNVGGLEFTLDSGVIGGLRHFAEQFQSVDPGPCTIVSQMKVSTEKQPARSPKPVRPKAPRR